MTAKRSLYAGSVALLLVLTLAAGCSRTPSDAEIAGQVQAKIHADANIPTKQIAVTSDKGVVTLSGTVGTEMERLAAANDAAQVPGVKTVVNNLQVAPPVVAEATPEPAVVERPRARPAVTRTRPRVYDEEPAPVAGAPAPAAAAPATAAPAPAVAPAPKPVTIPAGTVLTVRMLDGVDTRENQPGDIFRVTLDSPIFVNEQTVLPTGTDLEGRIVDLKSAGRFKGRSELALVLTSIHANGKTYQIETDDWTKEGASRGKRTAATVGGGAALGAVIGGIAGGGKGAAIGAAVGAGAGTGVQAATKGEQIVVEPEQILRFTLQAPVSVIPSPGRNQDRQRLP